MNEIILQCAYGAAYGALMQLTLPSHAALYPGVEIRQHVRNGPIHGIARHPTWDKIYWLNETMQAASDGDVVCVLDCDVLGVEACDPEYALDGRDFAAVRCARGWFNGGVQFWRVSPKTRAVVETIETHGPHNGSIEDLAITAYAESSLRFVNLPANYNLYRNALGFRKTLPIYFKAWHCEGIGIASAAIERELSYAKTDTANV